MYITKKEDNNYHNSCVQSLWRENSYRTRIKNHDYDYGHYLTIIIFFIYEYILSYFVIFLYFIICHDCNIIIMRYLYTDDLRMEKIPNIIAHIILLKKKHK